VLPARERNVDSAGDWRVIEPDDDQPEQSAKSGVVEVEERIPRWLIGAIVAVVGAACAFAIWATLPSGGVAIQPSGGAFDPRIVVGDLATPGASSVASDVVGASVIVDVEGAVMQPGVHKLEAGSRVGDAIAVAGGYSASADIEAAGTGLNLASKLSDGQQIHVPALGEVIVAAPLPGGGPGGGPGGAGQSPGSGGLIDINHASADELDTLPGIGPVTAAKIIDARTQAPFATVDELQSRGVVGQSTFDKLRDLITITP
jgi:competence protein ComEA